MKNLLFLFLLVFFNVSFADELSSESKKIIQYFNLNIKKKIFFQIK